MLASRLLLTKREEIELNSGNAFKMADAIHDRSQLGHLQQELAVLLLTLIRLS